jgi:hypothetical protein
MICYFTLLVGRVFASSSFFAALSSSVDSFSEEEQTTRFDHCSLLIAERAFLRLVRTCVTADCADVAWNFLDFQSGGSTYKPMAEIPIPGIPCAALLESPGVLTEAAQSLLSSAAVQPRVPAERQKQNEVFEKTEKYCDIRQGRERRLLLRDEEAVVTCGRWTRAVWRLHRSPRTSCDDLSEKLNLDVICELGQDDYQVVTKDERGRVVALRGGFFAELRLRLKRGTWKFQALICDEQVIKRVKNREARAIIRHGLKNFNVRFDAEPQSALNTLRLDQGSGLSLAQLCRLAQSRISPDTRGSCALM